MSGQPARVQPSSTQLGLDLVGVFVSALSGRSVCLERAVHQLTSA